MAKLNIDPNTGEIIPANVMVPAASLPSIIIDISDVQKYHKEPEKLVEIISNQAGYAVFDVTNAKGRDECRSHAANIIRCISPAINASKAMAEDAKKVVKQDLEFRNKFEAGIRELAAYHRKPLTEWEEEQARIKEAARLEELKRFEEEHYLLDWQDAIDFDELYTLRKEKEAEQKRAAEAQREAEEKARIEREVTERLEAERQRIRQEEEAKARREAEAKIRAEQEAEQRRRARSEYLEDGPAFTTRIFRRDDKQAPIAKFKEPALTEETMLDLKEQERAITLTIPDEDIATYKAFASADLDGLPVKTYPLSALFPEMVEGYMANEKPIRTIGRATELEIIDILSRHYHATPDEVLNRLEWFDVDAVKKVFLMGA